MAYLDGVKVGDKLWSIHFGECVVIDIYEGDEYSIRIGTTTLSDVEDEHYTMDGYYLRGHKLPSLFWSKPEFELPPRPKRMVKKEGWINIYSDGFTSNIHKSEQKANINLHSAKTRVACVKVEYEVEE